MALIVRGIRFLNTTIFNVQLLLYNNNPNNFFFAEYCQTHLQSILCLFVCAVKKYVIYTNLVEFFPTRFEGFNVFLLDLIKVVSYQFYFRNIKICVKVCDKSSLNVR